MDKGDILPVVKLYYIQSKLKDHLLYHEGGCSSVLTIIHQDTTWFQTWKGVAKASLWLLGDLILVDKISFYIIVSKEAFENRPVIHSSFKQNPPSAFCHNDSKGRAIVILCLQHHLDFDIIYIKVYYIYFLSLKYIYIS